jgi:DNA-binding transcriptional LysR family regulator
MDVTQARTFLAVVETGSFVEAAKRVFVTQSTVSMRIKQLEQQLGRKLFERSKGGARLTPAGAQFEKHALAIVRVWEHARLEIALPKNYTAAITIGGPYSLWDGFLLNWVARMRAEAPEIAIRTQIGFSNTLIQRLIDGTMAVGVMYAPQSRPGFEVEMLFEDEIVLVSSEPEPPSGRPGKDYIFVDWGPEFRADHSLNFPDLSTPGLYMELGSLGLNYLLQNRGSGYFPKRLVAPYLDDGRLQRIGQAPVFHYPAYAVYPTDSGLDSLDLILTNLRRVASSQV